MARKAYGRIQPFLPRLEHGDRTMQILIISDDAAFFQDVFQACSRLASGVPVQHHSVVSWQAGDLSLVAKSTLILVRQNDADALNLCSITQPTSQEPFALARMVCQNMGESVSDWERLSRDSVMLRLQEIGQMMHPQPEIRQEVIFETPHLRLTELTIPTLCRLIPVVRDRLLKSIQQYDLAGETGVNHFCMALEESLANAFYHGNLELCSSLKEDGSSRFVELAAEREQLAPYKSRFISISELVGKFGLWITIRDEGRGFDVKAALERANDPELMLASGRGLMMMQAFADELFFNIAGNEVTLALYSREESRELPVLVSEVSGTPTLVTDNQYSR